MNHRIAITLAVSGSVWLISTWTPALAEPRMIELTLRSRDDQDRIVETKEKVDPKKLAIVVMDIWDHHWCRTARGRTGALIPRMNYTLDAARRLGVCICFSPTGAMRDLWDSPQYKATKALPEHPMPAPKKLHFRGPRGGYCMCGPGYICMYHYTHTNQHPDLKMCDGDFIVLKTQEMYNLVKERGIEHIILFGEHTNICVLHKPCGIYPLGSRGFKKIYLGRDNTDAQTVYDPGGSTPYDGTQQVIRQIERYICPSIDTEQMLRDAGVWEGEPILDYVHISPWGRKYGDDVTPHPIRVELTLPQTRATRDAEVRYTLDGSDPGPESTRSGSIGLKDSRTLKAAAFRDGRRVTLISKAEFWKMPPTPPLPDVHLSDLEPISELTGQNTLKARQDRSVRGAALANYRVKYLKGVGVQAPSELVYEIKPEYRRFVALGGVDDEMSLVQRRAADLVFEVYIDDTRVANSPPMVNGDKAWGFNVSIPKGAKQLKLVVTDADDRLADPHGSGDWLYAGFIDHKARTARSLKGYSAAWRLMKVPGYWEQGSGGQLGSYDGLAWYRCFVKVPQSWAGKDLTLMVEEVDNVHQAYFNGVKVGGAGSLPPACRQQMHTTNHYKVPAKSVRPGRFNLVAVRVYDHGGAGGFARRAPALSARNETIQLEGDWQFRVGDRAGWAKWPEGSQPPQDATFTRIKKSRIQTDRDSGT